MSRMGGGPSRRQGLQRSRLSFFTPRKGPLSTPHYVNRVNLDLPEAKRKIFRIIGRVLPRRR